MGLMPLELALALAIGDSPLRKVVRGQLDRHAVPWHDADVVLPHLAGDVSYNLMAVLEFDTKLSTRKGLDNRSRQLDHLLISCHRYNLNNYINCENELQHLQTDSGAYSGRTVYICLSGDVSGLKMVFVGGSIPPSAMSTPSALKYRETVSKRGVVKPCSKPETVLC